MSTNGELYVNGNRIDEDGEYGTVTVFPGAIDNIAARAQTVADVPGNNGGIIVDEERYKNVAHSYNLIIKGVNSDGAGILKARVANKLNAAGGFVRVQDSFHSGEFYEAYLPDGITFTADDTRTMFKAALNFVRKPQRFLTYGEEWYDSPSGWSPSSGIEVTNAYMPSKPRIRLTRASGVTATPNFTMTLSGGSVRIYGTVGTWVAVDLESMSYSCQATDSSTTVAITGKPVIPNGSYTIRFSGNNYAIWIGSYRLQPRSWRL